MSTEHMSKLPAIVDGLDKLPAAPNFYCDACCTGKARAKPIHDNPIAVATEVGELTHRLFWPTFAFYARLHWFFRVFGSCLRL